MYDPTAVYDASDIERFWGYLDRQPNGCWLWAGGGNGNGYGRFFYRNRPNGKRGVGYPHRFAYEVMVEPIAPGLVIDHLCRNRSCVNPAHLEVVTHAENIARGEAPSAIAARRTHCPEGHALPPHVPGKKRTCKECRNAYRRARWAEGKSR